MAKNLALVLVNIRSAYNVGAIARSAAAFGANLIVTTGITPYPLLPDDIRLPHIATKAAAMISKTALQAETSVDWQYHDDPKTALTKLGAAGYHLYALEQATGSIRAQDFKPHWPAALILGPEVTGLDQSILKMAEAVVEIPLPGPKASLNVSVAAGIALFALTQT